MKLNNFDAAVDSALKVLADQPDNGKALFRAGQAYLSSGNVDKAKEYLEKAAQKEPSDKAIQSQLKLIKQKEEEQKKKEKQMYSKMFGK